MIKSINRYLPTESFLRVFVVVLLGLLLTIQPSFAQGEYTPVEQGISDSGGLVGSILITLFIIWVIYRVTKKVNASVIWGTLGLLALNLFSDESSALTIIGILGGAILGYIFFSKEKATDIKKILSDYVPDQTEPASGFVPSSADWDQQKNERFHEIERLFDGDQDMINSSKAVWMTSRGNYSGGKGDFDTARLDFEEAIRIKSDHLSAYFALAFVWVLKGENSKAAETLKAAPDQEMIHGNVIANKKDMLESVEMEDLRQIIQATETDTVSDKSSQSNFCTNCGTKLTNGANFCQACGKKVN